MTSLQLSRREFHHGSLASLAALLPMTKAMAAPAWQDRISVSSWSFHNYFPNTRYGPPKFEVEEWQIQEVVKRAKAKLGITAFEMSSAHLASQEPGYLDELNGFMKDQGCKFIHFCDNLRGVNLARADAAKREEDLKTFEKLIDVAQRLRIPTMRVNTGNPENKEYDFNDTIKSYKQLAGYGKERGVEIIIENHFGLSADPKNVVRILEAVGGNVSACPDFGLLPKGEERWPLLDQMCKHSKRVCSAKFHGLDDEGKHADFDLKRSYDVLVAAGFPGWVSLEYEGHYEPLPQLERMLPLSKKWLGFATPPA